MRGLQSQRRMYVEEVIMSGVIIKMAFEDQRVLWKVDIFQRVEVI